MTAIELLNSLPSLQIGMIQKKKKIHIHFKLRQFVI